MIPEKFKEVLSHEGVVAIVTNGPEGVHVANTWNSYLSIAQGEKIFIPVGGMNTTESNIKENNRVLITVGSREVQGFHSKGTGFLITAGANFLYSGNEYEQVKQKFPWIRAVLEITPDSIKQTL